MLMEPLPCPTAVDVPNLSDAERDLLVEIYRWEHEPYPRAEPEFIADKMNVKGAKRSEIIGQVELALRVSGGSVSPVPRYLLDAVLTGGFQNLDGEYLALKQLGLTQAAPQPATVTGRWTIGQRILHVTAKAEGAGKMRIEVSWDGGTPFLRLFGPLGNGSKLGRGVTLTGDGLRVARAIAPKKEMPKKRGRPSKVSERLHARIVTAWESGMHNTHQECATALSVSRADVVRALDRERKRQKRNRQSES